MKTMIATAAIAIVPVAIAQIPTSVKNKQVTVNLVTAYTSVQFAQVLVKIFLKDGNRLSYVAGTCFSQTCA